MSLDSFTALSGTVHIAASAPEAWRDVSELPFWENPNHEEWGRHLCRVLYHEALHFWQVLASGYLANLLADEWQRLKEYEQTRKFPAPRHRASAGRETAPFLEVELLEAWARYWDVHTRSPAQILEEEELAEEGEGPWVLTSVEGLSSYTGAAYDKVMKEGEDCAVYARPYRWLLERVEGRSATAALLFPLLTFEAFGSPDPVGVFCDAVDAAWGSEAVQQAVAHRSGNINLDWLLLRPVVLEQAVEPVLKRRRLPSFTSGLDVLRRGPLGTHPILREYLDKVQVRGFLKLYQPVPRSGSQQDRQEAEALWQTAQVDPMAVFALPGQPFYRRMLGQLVPPPHIHFENFSWYARRPVDRWMEARAQGRPQEETFALLSEELEPRVRRFRAAEAAVAYGLPPDAFEAALQEESTVGESPAPAAP